MPLIGVSKAYHADINGPVQYATGGFTHTVTGMTSITHCMVGVHITPVTGSPATFFATTYSGNVITMIAYSRVGSIQAEVPALTDLSAMLLHIFALGD